MKWFIKIKLTILRRTNSFLKASINSGEPLLSLVLKYNKTHKINITPEQLDYLIDNRGAGNFIEDAILHNRIENYNLTRSQWLKLAENGPDNDTILGLMLDNYDNNPYIWPELLTSAKHTQKLIEKTKSFDLTVLVEECDKNAVDARGWNTLMSALCYHSPYIDQLISGTDLSHRDDKGWDALTFALFYKTPLTAEQWSAIIPEELPSVLIKGQTVFDMARKTSMGDEDLRKIASMVMSKPIGLAGVINYIQEYDLKTFCVLFPTPHIERIHQYVLEFCPNEDFITVIEKYLMADIPAKKSKGFKL